MLFFPSTWCINLFMYFNTTVPLKKIPILRNCVCTLKVLILISEVNKYILTTITLHYWAWPKFCTTNYEAYLKIRRWFWLPDCVFSACTGCFSSYWGISVITLWYLQKFDVITKYHVYNIILILQIFTLHLLYITHIDNILQ